MIRGMQLPLAIWPDGPWRTRFSTPIVIGMAVGFALVIGLASFWSSHALASNLDLGLGAAVVVGTVVWGFAAGLIQQRPYLRWYGLAIILGVLPHGVGLVFGGNDLQVGLVAVAAAAPVVTQEPAVVTGSGGVVPTFLYLVAIGATSKLVTEELAFRRLIIGRPGDAGLVLLVAAAVIAGTWQWIVSQAGVQVVGSVAQFALAAACAGGVYILAGSLLVSVVFSSAYWAALGASSASRPADIEMMPLSTTASWPVTAATLTIGIVLSVLVVRRNGILGGVLKKVADDAACD